MRYGFISDVHGNLEALSKCLAHLDAAGMDQLIFLGDAVGYGPNPNEVCDIIRQRASVSIVGNHDAAVTGRMDYSGYYDSARESLDWCRERLSADNLAWLHGNPYKVRAGDVDFCHGSPVEPEAFEYIHSMQQAKQLVPHVSMLAAVTFIGHSHLPLSFCLRPDNGTWAVEQVLDAKVHCRPDAHYIITVGSVGQPRDRDPRACCGLFDSSTRLFEYQRLAYDALATRDKIYAAGLARVFGDRLLLGM